MLGVVIHTLHVMLAGGWLGWVAFTTFVVSPAFKAMKWSEVERVRARSMVGRYFARVGGWNLGLLLLFAIADGALGGLGSSSSSNTCSLRCSWYWLGRTALTLDARSRSWPRPRRGRGAPGRRSPSPGSGGLWVGSPLWSPPARRGDPRQARRGLRAGHGQQDALGHEGGSQELMAPGADERVRARQGLGRRAGARHPPAAWALDPSRRVALAVRGVRP